MTNIASRIAALLMLGGITAKAADNFLSIPTLPQPPTIDGTLSPGEWEVSGQLNAFRPADRSTRPAGAVRQRAWLTADAERFYLAFQTSGQNPTKISTSLTERDAAIYSEESMELHLAFDGTAEHKIQLVVNPAGIIFDKRGNDVAWNGDWQVRTSLNEQGWNLELSIPWSSLGLESPPADTARMLVVHNATTDSGISSYTWSQPLTNFHNITAYPSVAFNAGGLTGSLEPVTFADEMPQLTWQLRNTDDRPHAARATLDFVRSGIIRDDYPPITREVTVEPHGTAQLELTPQLKLSEPVEARLSLTDLTGNREVFYYQAPLEYLPDYPISLVAKNYLPAGRCRLIASSRLPDDTVVAYRLLTPSGQTAAEGDFTVRNHNGETEFAVTVAEGGDYRLQAEAVLPDGSPATFSQELPVLKNPEWLGNQCGLAHQVMPPYTPVTFTGEALHCLAGSYQFGNTNLPTQISSEGVPLLAAPIQLLADRNGATIDLSAGRLQPGEAAEDRIELAGSNAIEGLAYRAELSMEEDGFLWYELTLLPDRPQTLDRLALQIPFRPEIAEYIYPIDFTWNNYARTLDGDWHSAFRPVVTVYNDDRGLAWYAESMENWNCAAAEPLQLRPTAEGSVFSVALIDQPTVIDRPMKIGFGLQITPPKPYDARERRRRLTHWAGYDENLRDHLGTGALVYTPAEKFNPEAGTLVMTLRPEFPGGNTEIFSVSDSHGSLFRLFRQGGTGSWVGEQTTPDGDKLLFDTADLGLPADRINRQWTQLALCWDAGTIRLYENGREIGQAAASGLFGRPAENTEIRLCFGTTKVQADSSFQLRDLALFDRTTEPAAWQELSPDTAGVVLCENAGAAFRQYRTPGGGERFGVLSEVEIDGVKCWQLFNTFTDYRLGSGAQYSFTHQTWAKNYGDPYPADERRVKALHELVDHFHRRGGRLGLYYGGGLGDNAPMSRYFHDLWMSEPDSRWVPDSNWNGDWINYLDHAFSASCVGADYWTDFIAFHADKMIREFGTDGYYYDGAMFSGDCRNTAHGCGWIDRDGNLRDSFPLRKIHRHGKRLYQILMSRQADGLIFNHYSGNLMPLAGAWSHRLLLGEEYMIHQPGFQVDLPDFRAKFYGRQFGAPVEFLVYLNNPFQFREGLAYTLLHDINYSAYTLPALEGLVPVWRIFDRMNCENAEWLPYWHNRRQVRLSPQDPRIVCSLYLNAGESALAVVGNLTDEPQSVSVEIDPALLQFPGNTFSAAEMEWRRDLPVNDGKITIDIPVRDVRLIGITPGRTLPVK